MEQRVQHQPKAADPSLSLRDQAYFEIKRRINRLEYRPGAYLNEAQISRPLKIGRTPVHQALDRLMLEGLVQVIPRKSQSCNRCRSKRCCKSSKPDRAETEAAMRSHIESSRKYIMRAI